MNSIKCPNCGLTNFATATTCKRCKQNLEARSYPYWSETGAVEPPKPDWSKLQTVPAVPGETIDLDDYGDGSHTVGNILFAIYLVLSILTLLYSVYYVSSDSTHQLLKLVTTPSATLYLPSFEPMYYAMLLGTVVFLPAAVILLVTLCRKSRAFLTLVLMYLLAEFVYSVVTTWLFFKLGAELREKHIPQFDLAASQIQWLACLCLISILLNFIWARYFTKSERARLVFE